jgi:hypothetical protein
MKSPIKTCLVKSERTTGLTKLTICTAVILSLAFTANLSAGPTTTSFTLDGGEAWGGTPPGDMTLAAPYGLGNITFSGEIWEAKGDLDPEMVTAGSLGNSFDILGPHDIIGGDRTAEMFFDFDVLSIDFIYGGNYGTIMIEARDIYGNMVAKLDTQDTGASQPATLLSPLSGSSAIRSLYWIDDFIIPSSGAKVQNYAVLDNIEVTVAVIPSPSAFVLAGIGVSFVGWLRKRKIV